MKLKFSQFNEYTGVSKVILEKKGKQYEGLAVLHPDDWENASKYAGCRLAEKRALIKYYKERKNIARIKRDALISAYNDINNSNFTSAFTFTSSEQIDMYNKIMNGIRNHIKYWNDEYKYAKDTMKQLYQANQNEIKTREKLLKRTKENNKN